MEDNLQNILIQKFKQNTAAHFYIFSPQQIQNGEHFEEWIKSCILKAHNLQEKEFESHPDILYIKKIEGNKKYKQDIVSEINKFLSFDPLLLERKYIFIESVHLLPINLINKLLKTLEEPPVNCTFLFLNNMRAKLLGTLNSRAISIQVPLEKEYFANESISQEPVALHILIQDIKKCPQNEDQYFDTLINLQNKDLMQKLIRYQSIRQEDMTYNNAPQYRLFYLHHLLKTYAWHIGH